MLFKINRKIIIIYFICFVFLCSIFITDRVNAVSGNVYGGYINQAGDASCVGCPGGGYSGSYQSIASGYRITIINKDGTKYSESHDFWADWTMSTDSSSYCFNNHSGYSFLNNDSDCKGPNVSPHETKYKYTKYKTSKIYGNDEKGGTEDNRAKYDMSNSSKEFFLSDTYYSWLKSYSKFSDLYSIREKLIGITSGLGSGYNYPDNQYSNNFTKFAIETFIHAIEDLSSDDKSKSKNAKKAFSKLLNECGIEINNNNFSQLNGKYMLIETLLAVWDINDEKKILVGSLHDLKYLGYHPYDYNADPSLYTGLSNVNPIIYNTITIKDNSNNVVLNGCDATKSVAGNSDNPVSGTNKSNLFNANGCAGIFTIDLSDLVTETCDTKAKEYITVYNKDNNKDNYLSSLASDELTQKCISTTKMEGAKLIHSVKSECNVLDPDNIDLFKGYDHSVSGDVCVKYDCQTLADEIYKRYFISNSKKYEKEISRLKEKYPGNDMLETTYWKTASELPEIFGKVNGPKCDDGKVIDCEVTQNVVGNCEENGIKFSDSSKKIDGVECYKKGVSYSIGSVIQSSKDKKLSNSTCNVYCKESVIFNLPGSPSDLIGKDVAAGTVLKWGITTKDNKKFGEMTITRKCYASGTSCSLDNPMEWARVDGNHIGTKVSVYFKESNGDVKSHELETKLESVKFNGRTPSVSNESDFSYTPCRNFGEACTNFRGGEFTLSATYSFNYKEDAHNYSDKSTANGKVETNVSTGSSDPKYIDIGYGFPIKFTNRAYRYDIYDTANNKYLWSQLDTLSGYLYASIKNIGTKDSDGYHFDKIIKVTSLLDNSYVVSGNEHSVRYSCPFATTNPLMDAECFDKNGNKYPLGSSYCKDDEKPKGLDVVFRTVQLINKKVYETGNTSAIEDELNKAFPGRAGKGRYTGKDKNDNRIVGTNWLTIDSDEGNNTKRIFDILSNMVYAQQPAYHIVLNTTKINYIRKNNATYRSIKLDPYTDKQLYKFDKTNASDYSYGASDFISDLINKNWLDGECASGDKDYRAKRGACRQS